MLIMFQMIKSGVMRFFKVKQEATVVKPAYDVTLTSGGVSTCICISAKGLVGHTPYLAMHHWEGFSGFDKTAALAMPTAKMLINYLFKQFSKQIKKSMQKYIVDSSDLPTLDTLYLTGGERAAEGLSGTEFEVAALNAYTIEACTSWFRVIPGQTKFFANHFLTSSGDSLRLFLSSKALRLTFYDSFNSDEECESETEEILHLSTAAT